MARPKRTAASAAQTGAAQTRTAEVKKAAEVKSTAEVKTAEDVKKADEPAVKEAVKETVKPEIEKSGVRRQAGSCKGCAGAGGEGICEDSSGNRNQVYGAVHITGTECSLLCGKRRGFRRFQNRPVE